MIQYDTSTIQVLTGGTGPKTWSHTVTGSNTLLLVFLIDTNLNATGVTYNGVAMTQLINTTDFFGDPQSVWGLVNPTTGANTVSVSYTGSATLRGFSVSYTGVKQTGLPDAISSGNSGSATSTSPYSHSLTTVADNCWIVGAGAEANGIAVSMSGGTNFTSRQSQASVGNYGIILGDTNGIVSPAGATSQAFAWTGGVGAPSIMQVSIAPVPTPTITNSGFSSGASSGTTVSISATVQSGNKNTLLLAFYSSRSGGNTTTATYNGVAMTAGSAGGAAFGFETNYFYMANPPTGTNTLTVTYPTSSTDSGLSYIVLKDAFQGAPDADGYQASNNVTSISKSVTTTVANDLLIAWFAMWTGTSGQTEGGTQVRVGSTTFGALSDYGELSSFSFAGTGAQAMSLSWTTAKPADALVVAIKYQAPTTTTTTAGFLLKMI